MTEFEKRPYRPGDLEELEPCEAHRPEWRIARASNWAGAVPPGLAWTFLEHGRVIAIGGFVVPAGRPHVAEAWSIIGLPSRASWGRLLAYAARALEAMAVPRLEATARLDIPGAAAALERLGFEREGLHPKGGPEGLDIASYGRVGAGGG